MVDEVKRQQIIPSLLILCYLAMIVSCIGGVVAIITSSEVNLWVTIGLPGFGVMLALMIFFRNPL